MSLVIPPGFASAAFVHTSSLGTQPFVTTLGVDISNFGGTFSAAANFLFVTWDDTIMREVDTSLQLQKVTLSIGQDGPGGSVDSTLAPAGGARSGAEAPVAMAAIARKNTGQFGRSGRGRMFLPGVLGQADVSGDGSIVAARQAQINTRLTELLDTLVVGDPGGLNALPPVLLHSPGGPTLPTSIISLTCAPLVGWIRGRIR